MEDEEVLGEECFDSVIKDFCENLGIKITEDGEPLPQEEKMKWIEII